MATLHRCTIRYRYPLGARVRWASDPSQPYVVERWRYVCGHTGTWVEYLLAYRHGGTVCWAEEKYLEADEGV